MRGSVKLVVQVTETITEKRLKWYGHGERTKKNSNRREAESKNENKVERLL